MSDTTGTGINILLVHGAFVDASSWSKVIPLLQGKGVHVLAVQNPLTSLQDDIDTTTQALATLSGPTILVGHSYGGTVISNIGVQASNVVGLVYISAYAPEQGESVLDLNGKFPASPAAAHFVPSYREGFVWIDPPAFGANFVQDIPSIESNGLAAAENPTALICFEVPSGAPAWKRLPSWYMVSANDRTIQPDAERFMAKRIGATTREIPSSHASPVSHPYEVSELILEATQSIRH
ncbi:alpha/beta hydrolase [Ktedonobacter sp. SOSP1-85]|uniref:alpha/beta hydrolase n=1 Tax=Ktedonobacter sp. SOSP1-85 TaxID=2778367 RepID=UPI001915B889|nr:alpha/beta hydrolase [Ktedonobacter sp. SOSP1-85]GHO80416.1 alpha/beta hydrolase [Ktedonobacter sp. SOSP1-85]